MKCNENKSNKKEITKAASVVFLATFFSRITGYVRDVVFASFFGAGMLSDTFIAAFRIPNLLRRLLAEGSLSLSFIPVFTNYFVNGDSISAYELAECALKFLFLCLLCISVVGIIFTPVIVQFFTPGFIDAPTKIELTIKLTRIMFPYIIFIGMAALCMGILNVLNHFAVPAFSPILLNLSMITSIYIGALLYLSKEKLIVWVAIAVLLGGFLQLLIQLPIIVKKGVHISFFSGFWHNGFLQIGKAMVPIIFGAAVYQINVVICTILASLMSEGSITHLYYADRIVQFPLAIFAYALTSAVFPVLSKQILRNDIESASDVFVHSINFLFFLTLPSMAGLILLRQDIVEVLFGRGAFDSQAVALTSDVLLYYSIGLWSFSAVKLIGSVFFAFRDTITPVKGGVISIFFNIFVGILLMNFMGQSGLALATSISSMINLLILLYYLVDKLFLSSWKKVVINFLKTTICTLVMIIGIVIMRRVIIPNTFMNDLILVANLSICIILGVLLYFVVAAMMKMKQVEEIVKLIKFNVLNDKVK